jgi:hypothetical protein
MAPEIMVGIEQVTESGKIESLWTRLSRQHLSFLA